MNQKDQLKVINAGFTIIRMEGFVTPFQKIKYKNKTQRDWATLHKDFKSNAEMHRKMEELLKVQTIIED